MVNRILEETITRVNQAKKAVVVIGPRQVGKTTLLRNMITDALWLDGDEPDDRQFLRNVTSTELKARFGSHQVVIIDEAQRIENIGLTLKLIVDKIPDIQIIASGSSAFELANKVNEPLTGRKWEFIMLPLSFEEMSDHHGLQNEIRLIEHRMIYGYYPEVVMNPGNEVNLLRQLSSNYLYKDILTWERIQSPDKLERLVQALALQIGNLVSYHELGKIVGLSGETVEKYIQLLEKAYVIFRLNGFSRNLRKELSKSRKIYFYDTGLRNAVINQFSPLSLRNDTGALWENFIIAERIKYLRNHYLFPNYYFWRSKDQAEIDYLEEENGEISAYEVKFSPGKSVRFPRSFLEEYKPSETRVIHRENFQDWIKSFPGQRE